MPAPRTALAAALIRTALILTALAGCAPAARPAAAPPASGGSTAPAPNTTTTTSTTVAPPPPPPCAPGVRACVRLSTRQAWLMSAGLVDYGPVPIAHGGPANRTPTGTFPVSWKDAENTSSIYGTPMPYSVFFAPGGIAFHEGSITEDSHGCVRLTAEAARTFFDGLTAGQLVQVVV
ncbi:MAG TPA: L,D-transpeptidase [Actinophytocola sp.]|uniref:L,D-transpeptidase n=1 Tax=Actinophytocola sp. TaxID=1872138 RepID=UPI002DB80013|nr:L,D-transpeptidase [Actinophytocola sp.]HEU5472059.1 L,D-transpeptidase [Actinophytocola sp.]